jgi:hypothetical protein
MGVKMLLGPNVTVNQMFSGRSMWVEMSLGRSVGGHSVKVPCPFNEYLVVVKENYKHTGWITALSNISQLVQYLIKS